MSNSVHRSFGVLIRGAGLLTDDPKKRDLVEQSCVEHELDLRAFLRGVLRDSHLADDALQRTVVRAIECSASVNPQTVRGWLFQIALNEAREIKRSIARRGRLQQAVWEASGESDQKNDDGFWKAVASERQVVIEKALSHLNADYREVVIRRIQRGQTFAEIAEEMQKPLGTVLTWMRRALVELRNMDHLRDL